MAQLGFGDLEIPVDAETGSGSFEYVLPDGVAQGPAEWWQLELVFEIRFANDLSDESVYVSASTQSLAAAQVEFESAPSGGVAWTATDIVNGPTAGELSSAAAGSTISYENYLRYEGVVPGVNTLEVTIEQPGTLPVSSLIIDASSTALIWSDNSPFDIQLEVELPSRTVAVGDTFELPITVINSDPEPTRSTSVVGTILDSGGLAFPDADDPAETSVGFGDIAERSDRSMRVEALAEGTYNILLRASSTDYNDRDVVGVRVTVYENAPASRDWVKWGAGALLALGSVLMLTSRRRDH